MAIIIPMKKDIEIIKSEAIVRGRYKLSPLAIKFISVVISNLKRSDDKNEEYILKVKDFKELTGQKTKRIYELIEEALHDLLSNPLKIPVNKEETKFLMTNWVSSALYDAGQVSFLIDPRLKPILLEIKEKYLKYKLENILSLKSSYVIRLYEILKDWYERETRYGRKAEKIISLHELRDLLEVPKSYQYGNSSGIKNRILEKAKKEFEEFTDIIFDYQEIKTGRRVTHLKFIIRPNLKKIEAENKTHNNNIKCLKNFVALLRKNYSGNYKSFGFKNVDGKTYWLKMDKDGLVYGHDEINGNIDFNAIESKRIYCIWWEIAKNNSEYLELLENGLDFKEIYFNNANFRLEINQTIEFLRNEGVI